MLRYLARLKQDDLFLYGRDPLASCQARLLGPLSRSFPEPAAGGGPFPLGGFPRLEQTEAEQNLQLLSRPPCSF